MFKLRFYTPTNKEMIVQYKQSFVNAYDTNTINISYDVAIQVTNKEFNYRLKQLERIDKTQLNILS